MASFTPLQLRALDQSSLISVSSLLPARPSVTPVTLSNPHDLIKHVFWVSPFLVMKITGLREGVACLKGFPGGSAVKNPPANSGDAGSIPGSGTSPGEGNGNPLQCSCLENPMDRGAWRATVHGVAKSQRWLSD